MKTLAIIGGGAAGLAAAIAAGEQARTCGLDLSIVVYEADERVGRSILATGNGRCNFSNASIDVREYHNAVFAGEVFDSLAERFGQDYVHTFFSSLGLVWREEADGRQYPLANKASVVVDVLRAAAASLGVREQCESRVSSVDAPRGPGKLFTLRMSDGVFQRADAVIATCGGRAVDALEACGIAREPLRPVLGPLKVVAGDVPLVRELDNIRVKCAVTLSSSSGASGQRELTEVGELMFRKYGVSGICVFNLSRFAKQGDTLRIDFLQRGGIDEAAEFLQARYGMLSKRFGPSLTYADLLRGLVLPRVSDALLKSSDVKPASVFDPAHAGQLARLLSMFTLKIEGIADPDISQVRRGGFSVTAFDAGTMQSLDAPGFFAAGEALDVDGPCGGYNLHWAWSSGLVAGDSAARRLAGRLD